MATSQPTLNPSGLAWRLVRDRLIGEDEARTAHAEALKRREPFVQYVVQQKILDSRRIAIAACHEFGVPLFDIGTLDLEQVPTGLVDERLIRRHRALPIFRRGNRLFLAVSDPTNDQGLDEIRFNTGLTVEMVLVEEDKLGVAIDRAIEAQDTTMTDIMDAELETLDIATDDDETRDNDLNVDEAPIVRYVNKVLVDAIAGGASDIHFEPYEKTFRIRFRQDGLLREVANPPTNIAARLVARLKVMSRMNIAERRIPQDGRIKLKLSRNRDIDFRVNTLPTLYGEKVVLRILDSSAATVGVEELGMDPAQRDAFLEAIGKPYGMILVTGPTGSGKTVTLYSALNMLNQPEVNISTVEDPVEILVPGINQVNMNQKTGLTFAAALRAFLRQDPDIIMVGEIRDLETAEIAVKAAQTGHLVLSTLHTNDAPQSLTRLANMGVAPFNIASSVLLIMAQRLVRRLCPHCRAAEDLPREALLIEGFTDAEIDEGVTIYRPVGCERCTKGYRGRTGIFQVMRVSETIGRLIMEGGNALQLADEAQREGVADLRRSGLSKVKAGITSLEELNRVTKE
ncbi:type IV-A pilus assembly ATPase PilB [Thiococcus pfennigii]|jgi:type IV pilus assembly protein PilB|uniref:type IV-A pilus assembly ATPase PilB n=1 Tax=Thiococcus pfennigii TaxID=1057 RepID=UPI0019068058|nr:type IV-A pilus assembly ATPase PilB [Thiococcus pfennigii]MBK1733490.1 type IV-A pilus assembly ATPase PilB [Thiococcus pfennigii]